MRTAVRSGSSGEVDRVPNRGVGRLRYCVSVSRLSRLQESYQAPSRQQAQLILMVIAKTSHFGFARSSVLQGSALHPDRTLAGSGLLGHRSRSGQLVAVLIVPLIAVCGSDSNLLLLGVALGCQSRVLKSGLRHL